MSVAVIGGAGFIGSNLVDQLLVDGHEVVVLDNFSEGKRDNLPIWHKRLNIMKGDVRDLRDVTKAVQGATWVFHLAAMSRIQPSITNPLLSVEQNVLGTFNVLEASKEAGVKKVVYSASSSAYGRKNRPPHEEDMKTDCLNFYSLTKYVGEEMCKIYNDLYGLPTTSLRYFNVYGPKHQEEGSYATVVAIFMKQLRERKKMTIVSPGLQKRDFTFVSDVVRANIMAAMNKEATGTFNIGTGTNYDMFQVAAQVAKVAGVDCEYEMIPERPAEASVTKANISKAMNILGWKPEISFTDGLEITWGFQKKNSLIYIP